MKLKTSLAIGVLVTVALATWVVSCGGGPSGSSASMATVTTSLSDPPTCSVPDGPYSHVYISVSGVKMHRSSSASPGDSGWVDLAPGLGSAPIQVDLLSLGNNGCALAQLGINHLIEPGTYQQIRFYLAPDSATVAGNQCNGTNNCVVYNGVTHPLQLSSETQTGIKIPPGQLAGGAFTVEAGQARDLVIDFDACASIIRQGNGKFRLKPVLHAGQVAISASAINGQLVDSNTLTPIAGAQAIVALEANDGNGVDRVIMQTTPDANGYFVFCPVPAGTYEVVAVLQTGSGGSTVAYAATVTSGAQPGDALGKIPMHADAAPGLIDGMVSTKDGAAISEDITLYALEQMMIGGNNIKVTIPLADQLSSAITVTTVDDASCAAGTDCAPYTFTLPSKFVLPYLGTFSPGGTTYAQIPGPTVQYTVDALAFQPGSGSTPTCTPSELMTSLQDDHSTALEFDSGTTITAEDINFTGCD
jgi:hypothetical protein